MQRENTAKVIQSVKADVQCLVEVEDRPSIDAFDGDLLKSAFRYNMVIDGFDPRGIDVGFFSKLPIRSLRTHIFDVDSDGKRVFSRDCLQVELETPSGASLHLLINHFKSQGYGVAAENDAKSTKQATAVAKIIKADHNLSKDLVAVVGDFNDAPARQPLTLKPLLGVPGLHDVLALQFPTAADR